MTSTREEVVEVIASQLTELNRGLGYAEFEQIDESTVIYGSDGGLDSLGLVKFSVELEDVLQDRLGPAVVLTDESAITAEENPFRSVGSLADFVLSQLDR